MVRYGIKKCFETDVYLTVNSLLFSWIPEQTLKFGTLFSLSRLWYILFVLFYVTRGQCKMYKAWDQFILLYPIFYIFIPSHILKINWTKNSKQTLVNCHNDLFLHINKITRRRWINTLSTSWSDYCFCNSVVDIKMLNTT